VHIAGDVYVFGLSFDMSRVLHYLRYHSASSEAIAATLRMKREDLSAELVRLDAKGLIRGRTRYKHCGKAWVEWEAVQEAPCEDIRLVEPRAV